MTPGAITEPSVSDHWVTHDRKGIGREGKGREERHPSSISNWRQSPTAWMALREIGGGC